MRDGGQYKDNLAAGATYRTVRPPAGRKNPEKDSSASPIMDVYYEARLDRYKMLQVSTLPTGRSPSTLPSAAA
jgi:hypothetical protein